MRYKPTTTFELKCIIRYMYSYVHSFKTSLIVPLQCKTKNLLLHKFQYIFIVVLRYKTYKTKILFKPTIIHFMYLQQDGSLPKIKILYQLETLFLHIIICLLFITGYFMKKVLLATWALRDRQIVVIECVYTESTFFMKSAVAHIVKIRIKYRTQLIYICGEHRDS